MFFKLLLLFIVVPLVELAMLITIGQKIGLLATLAIVIITGTVGAALARQQGWNTWRRIQIALAQGQLPGNELLDGLMILVAGAFLLTPGLLTDSLGFALLIPPCREIIKSWLRRRFESQLADGVYEIHSKVIDT